jgi:N-methylhydantoinase B/oxoprolinase/acetone carboxylase alpha subunit
VLTIVRVSDIMGLSVRQYRRADKPGDLKMKITAQQKLEAEVNKLIKEFGEERAIQIIKSKNATGIFSTMKNYPNGVFIYCNSPEGGVLVGKRS